MCTSLLGEGQTHTSDEWAWDPHQTRKYWLCDVLGLRTCASGERLKLFLEFGKHLAQILWFSKTWQPCFIHATETYCPLCWAPAGFETKKTVANGCWSESYCRSKMLMTTTYKTPYGNTINKIIHANQKNKQIKKRKTKKPNEQKKANKQCRLFFFGPLKWLRQLNATKKTNYKNKN